MSAERKQPAPSGVTGMAVDKADPPILEVLAAVVPGFDSASYRDDTIKIFAEMGCERASALKLYTADRLENKFKLKAVVVDALDAKGLLKGGPPAPAAHGGLPGQGGGLNDSGGQNTGAANDDNKALLRSSSFALPKRPENIAQGVSPNDALLLPRRGLRRFVLQQARDNAEPVLFTAPPGSGKTSLIDLLMAEDLKGSAVLHISGLTFLTAVEAAVKGGTQPKTPTEFCLESVRRFVSSRPNPPDVSNFKDAMAVEIPYWIFDEAQHLYNYPDFFNELLKTPAHHTKVIMFASHSLVSPTRADSPTAVRKFDAKRFKLSRDEENFFLERLFSMPAVAPHYDRMQHVIEIIRKEVNGNVGMLRLFCIEAFQYCEYNPAAAVEAVTEQYLCAVSNHRSVTAQRFFGALEGLSDNERSMLTNLVQQEQIPVALAPKTEIPIDPTVRFFVRHAICYTVTQEDRSYLVFASEAHRRHYSSLIFPEHADSKLADNIDDFILLVLRTFDPTRLAQERDYTRKSKKEPSLAKETNLQHQFWRGAQWCLPSTVTLIGELSRIWAWRAKNRIAIDGEIDFWIDSTMRWGIELTRDGSKIREHLNRGVDDGKYTPLAPAAYRVVDFRWEREFRTEDRDYVVVQINEDCQSASVHFHGRAPVVIRFTGQRPSPRAPMQLDQ